MKIFRFLLLITAFVAFNPGGALHAQQSAPSAAPAPADSSALDAQKLATATELVKLLDTENIYKNLFSILQKTILPTLLQDNPHQNELIQKIIVDAFQKSFMTHVDAINANNALIYSKIFTLEDLQQLVVFYQSPVAQKMREHTAEIMQQAAVLNTPIIHQAMQETMQSLGIELKKNGLVVPKKLGI